MHNDGHKLLRTFGNMPLDDLTVCNNVNHIVGKLILPEHISSSVLLQRVLDGQKVLLLVFVVECLLWLLVWIHRWYLNLRCKGTAADCQVLSRKSGTGKLNAIILILSYPVKHIINEFAYFSRFPDTISIPQKNAVFIRPIHI